MTRAHRSLWILLALTVLAAGLLAQTLAGPASPAADVLLAASALLLLTTATLLARVLRYLSRPHPAATTRPQPPGRSR